MSYAVEGVTGAGFRCTFQGLSRKFQTIASLLSSLLSSCPYSFHPSFSPSLPLGLNPAPPLHTVLLMPSISPLLKSLHKLHILWATSLSLHLSSAQLHCRYISALKSFHKPASCYLVSSLTPLSLSSTPGFLPFPMISLNRCRVPCLYY